MSLVASDLLGETGRRYEARNAISGRMLSAHASERARAGLSKCAWRIGRQA